MKLSIMMRYPGGVYGADVLEAQDALPGETVEALVTRTLARKGPQYTNYCESLEIRLVKPPEREP